MAETCRCGASLKLVGNFATDTRLKDWRKTHRCLSPDEQRFRDVPERGGAGGGSVIGFAPNRWDHDTAPPLV
jgi:hypothetical protein